jgi:hypothetical protein
LALRDTKEIILIVQEIGDISEHTRNWYNKN